MSNYNTEKNNRNLKKKKGMYCQVIVDFYPQNHTHFMNKKKNKEFYPFEEKNDRKKDIVDDEEK